MKIKIKLITTSLHRFVMSFNALTKILESKYYKKETERTFVKLFNDD